MVGTQRDKYGMRRAGPRSTREFLLPLVQQLERAGGIGNFVAQIVGPAAVGVDIVEMLVQARGQQPGDHVEIFVVMRGQPARVALRLPPAEQPDGGSVARDFEFGG